MSEKRPTPTRNDHDDFCVNEGWELVRGATGKPVAHHRTYELELWDGRILRTRISKPVDRTDYSARMWSHILRQQLEVSSDEFWRCASDGVKADRGGPAIVPPRTAVPLYLVRELSRLGVPEAEILSLDAAGAARLYADLLAK